MAGLLIVFSAPSGAGKTTIINKLLQQFEGEFIFSISATTRLPRGNEVDGIDYYFLTEAEFKQKIENNEFVEWAIVHNHYYGTLKEKIDQHLNAGKKVILDLDVKGGLAIKKIYGHQAVLIFIKPPSFEVLDQRLNQRATESKTEIAKRLQRYQLEMEQAKYYDYEIENDQLDKALQEVTAIIKSYEN